MIELTVSLLFVVLSLDTECLAPTGGGGSFCKFNWATTWWRDQQPQVRIKSPISYLWAPNFVDSMQSERTFMSPSGSDAFHFLCCIVTDKPSWNEEYASPTSELPSSMVFLSPQFLINSNETSILATPVSRPPSRLCGNRFRCHILHHPCSLRCAYLCTERKTLLPSSAEGNQKSCVLSHEKGRQLFLFCFVDGTFKSREKLSWSERLCISVE